MGLMCNYIQFRCKLSTKLKKITKTLFSEKPLSILLYYRGIFQRDTIIINCDNVNKTDLQIKRRPHAIQSTAEEHDKPKNY